MSEHNNIENKKQIAKNTLFLYIRMFFIMAINLYASRVILNTLGVSDFGIYNLVGGVVSMASMFTTALAGASQRFISYELGRGDVIALKKVFSNSVAIHIIVSFIIVCVAEFLGGWLLNSKLNIDTERLYAANWVFQCAIITFILGVISVPFNAVIIAHEKMSAFAYISILESSLKLAVVFILTIVSIDKLILYAILQTCVAIIIRSTYSIYCRCHFEECRGNLLFDFSIMKNMFAFSGWNIIGNIGYLSRDQISNIIINLFFGTSVNAARGIATQVNGIVSTFASNFTTALSPQIVKQYASGDQEQSKKFMFLGTKISFFLMLIFATPMFAICHIVLGWWLVDVPIYTGVFLRFVLILQLINILGSYVSTAVQATGKIRDFMIGVSCILMLEIPITYVLFSNGFPPYYAMVPSLFTFILAVLFRYYILNKLLPQYDWSFFLQNVFLRCFLSAILSISLAFKFSLYISDFYGEFVVFSLSLLFSFLICMFIIYIVGLNSEEKNVILNFFKKHFKYRIKKI